MNVLIADANSRVRSALRLLLEQMPGIEAIHETFDADGLVAEVARRPPGLVLLDWRLAGKQSAELLSRLHGLKPGPRVIALSVFADDRKCALDSGADAFASKSCPPEELMTVLAASLPAH